MSNVQSAAESAVRLNIGESNETTVLGLNSLTLPLGFTRNVLTVEEFGVEIDTKITCGATYDDLAFAGNFVTGDTDGQTLLRTYATENTDITNIRFYIIYEGTPTTDDFVTLNLFDDTSGYFKVSSFQTPAAPKSGIYTLNVGMIVGGRTALYDHHIGGTTLTFTNGVPSTITDSASGFVTAGFVAGDSLIIEGCTTAANDGVYKIAAAGVAAGTLTLTEDNCFDTAPEPGIAGTVIHGGI